MTSKVTNSLLSTAALGVLTLGVYAITSERHNLAGVDPADVQGDPNHSHAEMLPVMLRAGGFVPREISRQAGEYILSINDQSGLPELSLRLERENGERMHEAKLSRRKPSWRQLLRLTPGTYMITEASHTDWACRITVTAR